MGREGENMKIKIKRMYEVIYTSSTAQSLQEAVEEAIREGVSLAGATLHNCLFDRPKFAGGDFRGAYFSNSTFYDIEGENCNFEGANLSSVRFFGGSLKGANLQRIKGGFAKFHQVEFHSASFEGANLKMSRFEGRGTKLPSLSSLEKTNLEGSTLLETHFPFGMCHGIDPTAA
jgi:uncharacterized protein YjbI with pentapeptide repeats